MLALALLFACTTDTDTAGSGDETDADTDTDTDTDTDADADTDTDTDTDTGGTCDPMNSGDDWAWNGECPQMRTPCEITVDGCSITIAYSSGMTMGMPYSGTIDGNTVDFANDGSVRGCTGTLEDPDTISGSCRDGCTFTLSR